MKILRIAGTTACLLVASATAVSAAAASKYAVLSLIGDSMTVVTYAPAVGSRLDRNLREAVLVKDPVFDRAAAKAVEQALQKVDPRNTATLLAGSAPNLFVDQWKLFEGSRLSLGEDLNASLRASGNSYMVVLTKHRAEARLGTGWTAGSGFLEGIGFYIDRDLSMEPHQTGTEAASGFLAPYAYVKLSLVELASSRVIREEVVKASRIVPRARVESRDPWSALTGDQKATMLRELVVTEIERVVPLLVGGARS